MAEAHPGSDSAVVTADELALLLAGEEGDPTGPNSTPGSRARYQKWLKDDERIRLEREAANQPLPPGDGDGDDLNDPVKESEDPEEEDMEVATTEDPIEGDPITVEGNGAGLKSPPKPDENGGKSPVPDASPAKDEE